MRFLFKIILFVLFYCSSADAAQTKNVLLVFAHPDDETMMRSVIMRMVEVGDQVSAIYLTRGEGGRDKEAHQTSEQLARTRTTELHNAAKLYGFKNLYQLKFPDNPLRDPLTQIPSRDASRFTHSGWPWDVDRIKSELKRIAALEKPDVVVTFFPNQPGTHAHHRATATLVEQTFEEHGFGPQAQGLYGFSEDPVESGANSKLPEETGRLEFSPLLLSRSDGPYHGKAYGEVGTEAALAHVSQLKDGTGKFIRNWRTNPPEVLTTIHSDSGIRPLLDAVGEVKGMIVVEKKP